jgi:hypothetical protein
VPKHVGPSKPEKHRNNDPKPRRDNRPPPPPLPKRDKPKDK